MVKLTKYSLDTRKCTKNVVIPSITASICQFWIKNGSAHKFLMSLDLDFQTQNEF